MRIPLLLVALPTIALADRTDVVDGRVRSDARWYKEAPYLTAPADPWAAVSGDQPLRWTEAQAEKWTARGDTNPCTAKEDHCLVRDAWFFASERDVERKKERPAAQVGVSVAVIGPDGPLRPWNARSTLKSAPYIGYRTVPATKATLVPGALAIALSADHTLTTAIDAIQAFWVIGVVDSVDHAAGTFKLVDYTADYPLHYARLVVLTWKEGGKVEIVGAKKRDKLAVQAKDVFLPPAEKPAP